MTMDIEVLRVALQAEAEPAKVEWMTSYMRNQFRFLGVTSPKIRIAAKPFLSAGGQAEPDELIEAADHCWAQPEREFQYVGCLLLRKWVKRLEGANLADLERYITTGSWWDTVDSLAAWSVGPLVAANPPLVEVMDQWIDHDNMWLARTAILHQLSYKADTDADRLFAYAERRAEDREFFIRKAIGWALRQHARVQPDEVRSFVAANEDTLSGLSKREALKHIGP